MRMHALEILPPILVEIGREVLSPFVRPEQADDFLFYLHHEAACCLVSYRYNTNEYLDAAITLFMADDMHLSIDLKSKRVCFYDVYVPLATVPLPNAELLSKIIRSYWEKHSPDPEYTPLDISPTGIAVAPLFR